MAVVGTLYATAVPNQLFLFSRGFDVVDCLYLVINCISVVNIVKGPYFFLSVCKKFFFFFSKLYKIVSILIFLFMLLVHVLYCVQFILSYGVRENRPQKVNSLRFKML